MISLAVTVPPGLLILIKRALISLSFSALTIISRTNSTIPRAIVAPVKERSFWLLTIPRKFIRRIFSGPSPCNTVSRKASIEGPN